MLKKYSVHQTIGQRIDAPLKIALLSTVSCLIMPVTTLAQNLVVTSDQTITTDQTYDNVTIENTGSDPVVTVENPANVTVSGITYIAYTAGSEGTLLLTGDGTTWDSTYLIVGDSGTGSLTIEDGADLTTSGITSIGYLSGSDGTVTLTGNGSTWNADGSLYVGYYGTGSLTIEDGADLTTSGSYTIGRSSGSDGTVTLTGNGSTWNADRSLYVGYSGTGSLTIEDGADLTTSRTTYIGTRSGSDSTVTLTGVGTTWVTNDDLYVGESGTGSLIIEDGADLTTSGTTYIGHSSGSDGTVTLTGAGTTWVTNDDLYVGESGTGILTISDDAALAASNGIDIGHGSGSSGTLNIGAASGQTAVAAGSVDTNAIVFGDGTGQIVFNHTDTDFTLDADISGGGSVLVESGTTMLTGANTYSGGTTISGGTLQIGNGGTSGSISGDITNNGTLAFNRSDALTYSDVISGTGSLTKSGTGTLSLTGTNTYSGGTTVEAGTLTAGTSTSFVANTAYTLNGGTFDLAGFDLSMSALSGTGDTLSLGSADFSVSQTRDYD